MQRLVVGVEFGENFSSDARMFVEVLRPAVCLMSDKAVYCTRITNDVVRGWHVLVVAYKQLKFQILMRVERGVPVGMYYA